MSKKTIYQYFPGKEEIAKAVVEHILSQIEHTIQSAELLEADPLTVLRSTLVQVKNHITRTGPLFLEDVQKYLPDLWQRIELFRAEKLRFIERLLLKAQEEGRGLRIEPRLAMVIFLEATQALVRPDVLYRHGFPMVEVLDALIEFFSTGLVSKEI